MKILLIPSATLIPLELQPQMGTIPMCLFPLQSVTMLERIYNWYRDTVDRVYVVIGQGGEKVCDFIAVKKLDIHIVEIDKLHDLGHTIWCGMNAVLSECENVNQVYINFGDTLLSNKSNASQLDVAYYAREVFSKDWTYFEYENGVIRSITDKGHAIPKNEQFGNVFTGVFEINHPQEWMENLDGAKRVPLSGVDSFYQALVQYSEKYPFAFISAEDWFDVGHKERYAQAKTMVAARVFNTIEIDSERGLLTKRSENKKKLIDEIKWYLKLPNQLQYLLPRVYRYSLDWNDPYVTMEYYGYTTLHEMLVYGDIDETQWRKIFSRLRFILKDMGRFRVDNTASDIKKALESIYIDKTVSRLKQLENDNRFSPFFDDNVVINGAVYPSLNKCICILQTVVKERLIANVPSFCIIHGDLCFSNILVENDLGFLRVIDPRGSFGDYDIYGDQRYEVAKLMHSMDGQYDYITEDMFSVQTNGNQITLEIPTRVQNIFLIFKDVFQEFLTSYGDLKLIESLLFLSMVPLHSDHLNRQYAMLATGVRLMCKAMEGEKDA